MLRVAELVAQRQQFYLLLVRVASQYGWM